MEKPEITEAAEPEEGMGALGKEVYDWLQSIMSALLLCVLLFTFCGRVVSVAGSSMVPTLLDSDKLIVSDLFYKPKQGDIVVLRQETLRDEPIVKRVIAIGGQLVDIDFDEGVVYVDGVALEEDYVNSPTIDEEDFDGEIIVPEGHVFVMGDNRNASTDSRDRRVGCVDERKIIGKAYFLIFPGREYPDEDLDFSRIGSVYK